MTAHLSDDQIHAYRRRSLGASDLLGISEHLAGCTACRDRVAKPEELAPAARAFKAALQREAASAHLDYEELEAYVDGSMSASRRLAFEEHTRNCPSCAADLEEIQAVRLELAAGREPASRRSIWNWLLGGRGGLVLAGAAACALLAVVLFRPPVPPKGTVAQVSQPEKLRPMMIRDGTRLVSIAANGTISGLEHLPDNDRVLLQHVLAEKQIAPPQSLADLETKAGVLLGAPGETSPGQLLEPLSIVVESQRPTFRWQPVAGATYRVSVYDADYNLVAQSGAISAPEWQVPQPLRRGARYSWQIAVTQNGAEFNVPTPPAPEARFRVVSDADEAGIRRARAEAPDSRLLLGVLYARAGMLKEAGQELRALQQQNPDSAEITALLASIQNLRRPSAQ